MLKERRDITTYNQDTFLIWDVAESPPTGDWKTVLLCEYVVSSKQDIISVPFLVEEQSETLRNQYLAWIYDLGEIRIKDKRMVDHLSLRPDFSYWWMTSLAQKFNISDNSQINNIIKAFVLESLISEHEPTSIVFVSNNDKFAKCLENLCKNLGLKFKWDFVKKQKKKVPVARRLYNFLPYILQVFITLFLYYFKFFSLRRTKHVVSSIRSDIFFIDVLVHLNKKAFTSKSFISNYWGELVDKLMKLNIKTAWLHLYFYQKSITFPARAKKLLGSFNINSNEMQSHMLLEESLTLHVIVKALKDYLYINLVSIKVFKKKYEFIPAGSNLELWPLIKDEWIDSIRGPSAIIHCLRISLYEKVFSEISHQKIGLYIQENQPWEMALINAWKRAGHGKLIGVPHTIVRFWDLRYFYDYRSYERTGQNSLPIPDLVAVNGPVAKKTYIEAKYPELLLAEVEALRFMHLLDDAKIKFVSNSSEMVLKVLVCGDFLSSTNDKMLSWLTIAAQSLPNETQYIFKPHPANSIDIRKFPALTLKITDSPLTELLVECNIVFTSNITSAAVDVYFSDVPLIQMLDGTTFNMSSLRGMKGIVFVRNPKELHNALSNVHHEKNVMHEPYFYLDEDLPRWKKLLDINSVDTIY